MKAHQSYSWELPLPIIDVDTNTEYLSASVTATQLTQIRGLETTIVKPLETLPVGITPEVTVAAYETIKSNKNHNEPVNVGTSTTMSTEIQQVGVSPV